MVRRYLVEAAGVLLERMSKRCALKDWWLRLAKQSGLKKAKVAVASKVAVILRRMGYDGTDLKWVSKGIAAYASLL